MAEWITNDEQLLKAIDEVLVGLPGADKLHGTYRFQKIESGLTLDKNGDTGVIGYGDRRAAIRAISVLAEHIDEDVVSINQQQMERLEQVFDLHYWSEQSKIVRFGTTAFTTEQAMDRLVALISL